MSTPPPARRSRAMTSYRKHPPSLVRAVLEAVRDLKDARPEAPVQEALPLIQERGIVKADGTPFDVKTLRNLVYVHSGGVRTLTKAARRRRLTSQKAASRRASPKTREPATPRAPRGSGPLAAVASILRDEALPLETRVTLGLTVIDAFL